MLECDDGEALLARLGPVDRATLEALVDSFLRDELRPAGAGCIAYAARSFEERAAGLPQAKRLVVLRFAAALRARLARPAHH